jgi:hypothetical protein
MPIKPWSTVAAVKLRVAQLVKQSEDFYGTRWYIIVFVAATGLYREKYEFSSHFVSLMSILILSAGFEY